MDQPVIIPPFGGGRPPSQRILTSHPSDGYHISVNPFRANWDQLRRPADFIRPSHLERRAAYCGASERPVFEAGIMPGTASVISVNQLILDCAELSRRLEAIHQENLCFFASGLEGVCVDFELLLQRRNALLLAAEDTGLIQIMLDGLRARLRSLERRV
jgi:hypothetical protein